MTQETLNRIVLNGGDLHGLSPEEKTEYYHTLCERAGVDPTTQPFKLMKLNGKEVLYADKTCAQQLNRLHGLSQVITSQSTIADDSVYVVCVRTTGKDGRHCDSMGAVPISGLKGENLANALLKCATKANRRGTLEYCGLGMLDEMEVNSIAGAETSSDPVGVATFKTDGRPAPRNVERDPINSRDGGVRITALETKDGTGKNGKPWKKYTVRFSDGIKASCFEGDAARAAVKFYASGDPVYYKTSRNKNGFGEDLLELHHYEMMEELNEVPPPTDDDFPF